MHHTDRISYLKGNRAGVFPVANRLYERFYNERPNQDKIYSESWFRERITAMVWPLDERDYIIDGGCMSGKYRCRPGIKLDVVRDKNGKLLPQYCS